MIVKPESDNL